MAERLLYGVQGEGRGHASRSVQIIDSLRARGYEVLVLSGGDALPIFEAQKITVTSIPLLRYRHNSDGSLSFVKTLFFNFTTTMGLILGIGRKYSRVAAIARDFQPDLILSDFEPYSSRIARQLGVPSIAIDHQHFLIETELPRQSRMTKRLMLLAFQILTRFLAGKPDKIITSSFFHFPRRQRSKAVFVGPFIDRRIREKSEENNEHVTVYIKKPNYILELLPAMLEHREQRFEVFSDWKSREFTPIDFPNICFSPIDKEKFLASLTGSKALITTAGNQVLGEAIFLKKPILAFPEPNIIEQELNGAALERSGYGRSLELSEICHRQLGHFLHQIPDYMRQPSWEFGDLRYDGTRKTLRTIERFLRRHKRKLARQTSHRRPALPTPPSPI